MKFFSRYLMLIVTLSLLIIPFSSADARRNMPEVFAGMKLSLVSSGQKWDFPNDINLISESKLGWEFGLYMEFMYLPHFSAVYGVHIIEKGMKDKVDVNEMAEMIPGTEEHINRIYYLSVPILFKLKYSKKKVIPYFIIGPRIELFLTSKSENFQGIYNVFKETIIGLDAGAGFEFEFVEDFSMTFEVRYSGDLENSYNRDYGKIYNISREITWGIRYNGPWDELLAF